MQYETHTVFSPYIHKSSSSLENVIKNFDSGVQGCVSRIRWASAPAVPQHPEEAACGNWSGAVRRVGAGAAAGPGQERWFSFCLGNELPHHNPMWLFIIDRRSPTRLEGIETAPPSNSSPLWIAIWSRETPENQLILLQTGNFSQVQTQQVCFEIAFGGVHHVCKGPTTQPLPYRDRASSSRGQRPAPRCHSHGQRHGQLLRRYF